MSRVLPGLLSTLLATFACPVIAQGTRVAVEVDVRPEAPKPSRPKPATWNPQQPVLFKGVVVGKQVAGPYADGRKYLTLLVRLSNGGTAMVELGPSDWIESTGLEPKMRETLWVAGTKSAVSPSDTIVAAERLNLRGERVVLRKPDGTPLWK